MSEVDHSHHPLHPLPFIHSDELSARNFLIVLLFLPGGNDANGVRFFRLTVF